MLNPGKPDVIFSPKTFESILWNKDAGILQKTTSGKVYDFMIRIPNEPGMNKNKNQSTVEFFMSLEHSK